MMKDKSVLIVEDDMIISLVVENMVKKLGFKVVGKTISGEEAVTLATDLKPELVLMDVRLKGELDGIDAVEMIKKVYEPHIVYLTGNSDKLNYERAKKTNYADLLVKPFTLDDLKKSLSSLN